QRLWLVGSALALAGVITSTAVWGDPADGRRPMQTKVKDGAPAELKSGESQAAARFAEKPVVSYTTSKGERVFGAQLKPDLGPTTVRPRDVLVMIDTSASQAGPSYELARTITRSLSESLGADDRLSIWTVNIPSATRSLTKGFVSPKAPIVA